MSEATTPRLSKAFFVIGDLLLVGVAVWLALRPGPRLDLWHDVMVCACVALGAWLAVLPFLLEHRAQVRLAEIEGLVATIEQVKGLQAVGEQVAAATGRWQTAQEAAEKTAQTAQEIADRLTAEARNFAESMQKAHDAEVRNLRLEVEKMRRAEGDWLHVLVRVLDHVYALHSAGLHSGQPELIAQLGQFQNACRDVARRVGLAPLEAEPGARFEERLHEVAEGGGTPTEGQVAQTLATGYTYQGQLIRRVLVALAPPAEPVQDAAVSTPKS